MLAMTRGQPVLGESRQQHFRQQMRVVHILTVANAGTTQKQHVEAEDVLPDDRGIAKELFEFGRDCPHLRRCPNGFVRNTG